MGVRIERAWWRVVHIGRVTFTFTIHYRGKDA